MMNNKGFSLVELLIAVAIAGIVGASVFGFMTVGARTFASTSSDVNIQNEAQLAFNQIQNLVIDTAVGIDYEYVDSGEPFSTDTHKVVRDSEIPASAIGKKLIMYNTTASGRSVYEIIWHIADRKLYYNEYKAVTNHGAIIKGDMIGEVENDSYGNPLPGILMAEYVSGFEADVSQVETKRVVRLDLTFEKSGKSYTSSHNITLRNKIVSGNEIPEFMVSENSIALSKEITGPVDLYVEPGDSLNIYARYKVLDTNGSENPDASMIFRVDTGYAHYAETHALGSDITAMGDLIVSRAQKNDFGIVVYSGDGLATPLPVNIHIVRITGIKDIKWSHTGSIGTGEISGGNPTKEDLIEGEQFKLTVNGTPKVNGSNIPQTQPTELGKTIEDDIVFIKTTGSDLFTITDQDGSSCTCIIKSIDADEDLWEEKEEGEKKFKTTKIGIVAVSLYSMGGRDHFDASKLTKSDLSLSEFNYKEDSFNPTSIGAHRYDAQSARNRYYDSGKTAPVDEPWEGHIYAENSSINIVGGNNMKRGDHYPIKLMYGDGTVDFGGNNLGNINLKDNKGNTIDWTKYFGVVHIKLVEDHYVEGSDVRDEATSSTIDPYMDTSRNPGYIGPEGAAFGIICGRGFSPNSDLTYHITLYLVDRNGVSNECKNSVQAGNCYVFGQVNGLTQADLKRNNTIKSNTVQVKFSRLVLSFKKDSEAKSGNVIIFDEKNDKYRNKNVNYYPRAFGVEYPSQAVKEFTTTVSGNSVTYSNTIKFNYSNEFNKSPSDFSSGEVWAYYTKSGDQWTKFSNRDGFEPLKAEGQVSNMDNKEGKLMFEYNPSKITNSTPKHLRLYSTYKSNSDGNIEERLFNNFINVWLWNIEIPSAYEVVENNETKYVTCSSFNSEEISKLENSGAKKLLDGQTSYFPVPSDYNFPGTGTKQIWTGAVLKDQNKKTRSIWYTLNVKSYSSATVPSAYSLKLEYKDDNNITRTLGTYECAADGHEWH